ncbi:MAG: hypothetical protein HF962_00260 [Sulfurovum sp.]|nr:hypothetical protein [Sulfurovum sp.]
MQKNSNHNYFINREDAAIHLYDAIPADFFKDREVIVIALSEGGVIIADILAQKLDCSMDILLTESILAPNNSELSIAKVTETQEVLIHNALINSFEIDEEFVYKEAKRIYDEKILSYLYKYRKGSNLQQVSGKAVILVDECVETDFTAIVAIKSMIAMQAKNIYVATPILDEVSYNSLTQVSDGVFYSHRIRDYISIEYYYENLEKPEFSELERILKQYE